jgi:Mrp family chromosome partitioning ATPase
MLYLALTATGTKMRTVSITGEERGVVATVAARLALAAAGDARATLVVDFDPEGSSLGGYYHVSPEPGFTDAVAGVHLWRDVTHSVGASEGLAIDVVAGGSIRRDEPDQATLASARSEFDRVRGEYDLCVVAAPTPIALRRFSALVTSPVTVLCAELGTTPIAWATAEAARARLEGVAIQGLVLWHGAPPRLPTRASQLPSSARPGTANTV